MSVGANCLEIFARIRASERQAGRMAGEVKLIAVSKTKPLEMIDEAVAAGALEFGENYVQEAIVKVAERPELIWHFIGGIQTNKAKDVVGKFALLHSVDREKLARELDKAAAALEIVQDVLIQVRIGDEDTKHGVPPEDTCAFVRSFHQFRNLRVRGLMSLPPLTDNEQRSRGYFAQVRELANLVKREPPSDAFDVLSMGTTGDFEWAILEGATHVRVGTAIFGRRE